MSSFRQPPFIWRRGRRKDHDWCVTWPTACSAVHSWLGAAVWDKAGRQLMAACNRIKLTLYSVNEVKYYSLASHVLVNVV